MEYYLIIARSVTYAQRIERVLSRAGIRALVFRAPLELTKDEGCAYAVRIPLKAMPEAWEVLRKNKLDQVRIWISDADGIREVGG